MPLYFSPVGNEQHFDGNGDPLSGGKLYSYAAGSSTAQSTYTDNTGATPQANPIVLNSRGEPASPVWLTGGLSYKFILKDSSDVTIWTKDNITGINDASSAIDQWVASDLTPNYVSATQFTLAGDQTTAFHVGRRVKCTVSAGTVYGRISVTAYTTLTTVTVVLDSGSLDSGFSAVSYGLITVTNSSLGTAALKNTGTSGDAVPLLNTNALHTGHETFQGRLNTASAVGGTVDAITATFDPPFTAWVDKMRVVFRATGANTSTTPTIAVDGLVAKTLVKENLVALAASDIAGAGHEVVGIYNATADKVVMLNPKAAGAPKILQVVHYDTGLLASGTTVIPYDNTIPQNTEGDEYMSLAITPQKADSILQVEVVWNGSISTVSSVSAALFRDTVADAIRAIAISPGADTATVSLYFSAKVTSGSTALTTFKVRAGKRDAGTTYFNGTTGGLQLFGGVMASSIRITEISA